MPENTTIQSIKLEPMPQLNELSEGKNSEGSDIHVVLADGKDSALPIDREQRTSYCQLKTPAPLPSDVIARAQKDREIEVTKFPIDTPVAPANTPVAELKRKLPTLIFTNDSTTVEDVTGDSDTYEGVEHSVSSARQHLARLKREGSVTEEGGSVRRPLTPTRIGSRIHGALSSFTNITNIIAPSVSPGPAMSWDRVARRAESKSSSSTSTTPPTVSNPGAASFLPGLRRADSQSYEGMPSAVPETKQLIVSTTSILNRSGTSLPGISIDKSFSSSVDSRRGASEIARPRCASVLFANFPSVSGSGAVRQSDSGTSSYSSLLPIRPQSSSGAAISSGNTGKYGESYSGLYSAVPKPMK